MRARRMHPEQRRCAILAAAMPLAEAWGFDLITRAQVAEAAGVTAPVVSQHFGGMDGFRTAVMEQAVREGNLRVVGQGLARRHPVAVAADPSIKRAAVQHLAW